MKAAIRTVCSSPASLKNVCKSATGFKQFMPATTNSVISSILCNSSSHCAIRKFSSSRVGNNQIALEEVSSNVVPASPVYGRIGKESFGEEIASVLMAPIPEHDIEVKPDGILYLPEIKYRRILNKAFGPGGWCLVPISEFKIEKGSIIQEYALICRGQFVSQAFGEQTVDEQGFKSIGSSLEGAKSNALMRCCKDIGIASELWDPNFIFEFKKNKVVEAFCEHAQKKTTKKIFRRADREFTYPWVEKKFGKSKAVEEVSAAVEPNIGEEDISEEPQTSYSTPDSVEQEASLFDNFGMDDGPAQFKKEPAKKSFTSTTSNSRSGYQFDAEGTFPFGIHKGKLIKDLVQTPAFKGYLAYMEKTNIQPQFVSAVKAYMVERGLL